MSKLDVLKAFEISVLDGLPTGKAASELLDRLKAVESMIAEIGAHYKEARSRDSPAVPGWFLPPGSNPTSSHRSDGSLSPGEPDAQPGAIRRLRHGQAWRAGTPMGE